MSHLLRWLFFCMIYDTHKSESFNRFIRINKKNLFQIKKAASSETAFFILYCIINLVLVTQGCHCCN